MVWGCIGWNGVGMLVEVQGILDVNQFCSILEEGLVESFEKLKMNEDDRIFQQVNNLKHTSKKGQRWLLDNNIRLLDWPPQSPDINPLEHLWGHLKQHLKYDTPPKGVHELWERLVKEWNAISPDVCQKLIESMPGRIQAVLKAKGGHTKY